MPLPSGLQLFCRKINWWCYGDFILYDSVFLMLPLEFSLNICCFDNDASLCRSAWVYLIWDPLFLLLLAICFHLQYWNVFTHNFISYILMLSFFLPLRPLYCGCWYVWFYLTSKFFSFFKICFSFCYSDLVIFIILSCRSLTCSLYHLVWYSFLLQIPYFNNTREDSTHGHLKIVNTKIRLIIFFAVKDGEALYSQQNQDQELTVAQIMNSLLPNSDFNWRK